MVDRRYSRRGSLFAKSFVALFLAVVLPLTASGVSDAWFGYRAQREQLDRLLGVEARAAASRIQGFLDGLTGQLEWLVHLPWPDEFNEHRRVDALRLLRQVPAIASLTLLDGQGRERLHVSRIGLNRKETRTDRQAEPGFAGTRTKRVWFSEVSYQRGSEPYFTVALAGHRPSAGVVLAEVNLKLIWDVVSSIKIGEAGRAFVLDRRGHLVAHPDLSLVLRGADDATLAPFRTMRAAVIAAEGRIVTGEGAGGRAVAAASAHVAGVDWSVMVEQPLAEAFAPIYASLWRTAGLLVAAAMLAGLLAFWLARRMTGPIQILERGAELIGQGQFDHRIGLRTGDELQRLAESFNSMASGLAESQARQERIAKLKRFLAPQVAELVDRTGGDDVLEGRRADVVVLFGDLRGFTAFSAKASPDEVMHVLAHYHECLGSIVTRYGATLVCYTGDGVMVLVNAPVPVADPALHALDMAAEIQNAVQKLVRQWKGRGYAMGYGVGLAFGPATVGRIGYEGRYDYTAIGCVTNLASRLCDAARDGEILVDAAIVAAANGRRPLTPRGSRPLKGFDREIAVFSLDPCSLNPAA
ncbi:MAG TPA: adenylate/guanylate cyclase domain-containing protein [Microvirga sp.]|jgi:class 3 adenylate cyclase|nr:adenylate/guanylate cyclase domain-containing protein [Microvirga sp.]